MAKLCKFSCQQSVYELVNVFKEIKILYKIMILVVLQQLYQQGARVVWIHNTGPLGCLPASLAYKLPEPSDLDQNGCLKPHNEVAQEFNRKLKERVLNLRTQLSDAVLTYVDIYAAKYTLINEAEKYGKFFRFMCLASFLYFISFAYPKAYSLASGNFRFF